jgi:hypothetical protein
MDRWGTALLAVLGLGALGGAIPRVMSRGESQLRWIQMASAFAAGALVSEFCGFLWYYIDYGHRDPEVVLGLMASLLEFFAIAAAGGTATALGMYLGGLVQNSQSKQGDLSSKE